MAAAGEAGEGKLPVVCCSNNRIEFYVARHTPNRLAQLVVVLQHRQVGDADLVPVDVSGIGDRLTVDRLP